MRKVLLSALREASKTKQAGYLDECFALGKIEGGFINFSEEDFSALSLKYVSPRVAELEKLCSGCANRVDRARCALVEQGCQKALLKAEKCPIGKWHV